MFVCATILDLSMSLIFENETFFKLGKETNKNSNVIDKEKPADGMKKEE